MQLFHVSMIIRTGLGHVGAAGVGVAAVDVVCVVAVAVAVAVAAVVGVTVAVAVMVGERLFLLLLIAPHTREPKSLNYRQGPGVPAVASQAPRLLWTLPERDCRLRFFGVLNAGEMELFNRGSQCENHRKGFCSPEASGPSGLSGLQSALEASRDLCGLSEEGLACESRCQTGQVPHVQREHVILEFFAAPWLNSKLRLPFVFCRTRTWRASPIESTEQPNRYPMTLCEDCQC